MKLHEVEHDKLNGFIEAWKVETAPKGLWAFPVVILTFPAICIMGDVNIILSTLITAITSIFSFCFYFYSKKKITENKDMFFLTLGIFHCCFLLIQVIVLMLFSLIGIRKIFYFYLYI